MTLKKHITDNYRPEYHSVMIAEVEAIKANDIDWQRIEIKETKYKPKSREFARMFVDGKAWGLFRNRIEKAKVECEFVRVGESNV